MTECNVTITPIWIIIHADRWWRQTYLYISMDPEELDLSQCMLDGLDGVMFKRSSDLNR